ncbi:anti-sigma factor [Actinoplanes sp. N902-109]|uniref:anti-sigma factor n=1 Tax=Actinoplanes sp. (strain N902-109) TaxID=649831 RepID=UPI00032955CA|nr:anti-sigma factor [Actinoplanes sp. N902-109]AGL19143.1 hypothetical protein L083_5633 [Actinoplanes sp. N902-109]
MPHLDPDRLVLIALGEQDPSVTESEHLRHCTVCGADLDATRATVSAGRETQHLHELTAPPEDLWARIAGSAFATIPSPNGHAPVAPARSRSAGRRGRRLVLAAAAVVVLAAAAGVGILWSGRHPRERVVAVADLVAQPAAPSSATGRATIVDTGHGLQMRVSMAGMPPAGGYYTVWLYDGRTVMVPIGSPGPAPLNVPAAVGDLTRFAIVDVSAQQLGQQEHGTSMLQGRLHP